MAPTITKRKIVSTKSKKAKSKNSTDVISNLSSSLKSTPSSSSSKLTSVKSTRDSNIHVTANQKAKSEIDSIFSVSHESRQPDATLTATTIVSGESSTSGKKRKRKKGKGKDNEETTKEMGDEEGEWTGFGDNDVSKSQSSPATTTRKVETVIDPSLSSSKKRKRDVETFSSATAKKQTDGERFKDSRGTGPRRRTEEGYGIYKEDELGINEVGGDTPLCPFDCSCCF